MSRNKVDLVSIFQTVTQTLAENQQSLNQADIYNQDHGNNMVQTFQTITQALQEKRGRSSSAALNYAARRLSKATSSGSGRQYAENLTLAAMQLLQTLIGGGQVSSQTESDPLSSLLGGLLGDSASPTRSAPQTGSDLLGALLGGVLPGGETPAANAPAGLSLETLLKLGMTLIQGKQDGGSVLPALIQALLAHSGMGDSPHRNQSTQLVVNAFLQALAALST